ncbi:MAG: phage tail tape measure protein [bacterium]|nr:phage tail tape measure protein [bacterium]
MANVMEIIIKAIDQASDTIEKIGKNSKQAASWMEQNWVKVTAAGVAVGGAMTKMTNRSFELNDGLRRTAAITGENETELRKMIQAMTNATFSNDDAVRGMERLIQSGVTTKAEFENLLPTFDKFSDATGKDIVESIDIFDRMLSALGIPLSETEEHLDSLTFLASQTTVNMDNLGQLMRREAPALKDLGLSVDDVVVAMAALEAEGRRGPRAVMGFQEAIRNAEGDVNKFWQELGVANETLEEQRKRLKNSAGLTDELAEINTRSLGVWANLKHNIDSAMWSIGTFLEPVKDLGPLMMGLGLAIKGVSTAKEALSTISLKSMVPAFLAAVKATWAFTAALLANPITWIVVLIVGLIAAIVLLWKNWDTVSEWLVNSWEWIKDKATAIFQAIADFFVGIWDWIKEIFQKALSFIVDLFFKYHPLGIIIANWEEISQFFIEVWERIKEIFTNALNAVWNAIQNVWNRVRDVTSNIWGGIKNTITNLINTIRNVIGTTFDWMSSKITGVWERVRSTTRSIWDSMVGIIKAPINGIIGLMNGMINALNRVKINIPKIPDWIPGIGGKGGGSIGFNIPNIPQLARGGFIRAGNPTPAIIGEGVHDEAVLPLSESVLGRLAQAIADRIGSGGGGGEFVITVPLYIDGREVARATTPHISTNLMRKQNARDRAKGRG